MLRVSKDFDALPEEKFWYYSSRYSRNVHTIWISVLIAGQFFQDPLEHHTDILVA